MANRSLNQIVNQITASAEAHPQINTVRFEPPANYLDSGDVRYPLLMFYYLGFRKEGDLQTLNFSMRVLDMMFKEADNEKEVWSDTAQIAADMINYLNDNDHPYELVDSIEVQALSRVDPDLLSGHMFDFSLRMPMPSPCLAPVRAEGFIITEDGSPIYTEDGHALTIE